MGTVGFAGPRHGPAATAGIVAVLVNNALVNERQIATGCAVGVDALTVAAAMPRAARMTIFCAYGPDGAGQTAPTLENIRAAQNAGAIVNWWAGGIDHNAVNRLVNRSLAFVRHLANAGPGSALVIVTNGPPPRAYNYMRARPGEWATCGSGTWGSAGTAALLGLPVILFKVGHFEPPQLPGKPGHWEPATSSMTSPWSNGYMWRT